MSYIALYRKWRPLLFEDVVEQQHIVKTLRNSVRTGRVVHAYLFCGTRGTGKTTLAKIFSRAINCLSPKDGDPCNECEICKGILNGSILDVIEIDAASNNGVDNIREIRDEVAYAPSRTKYKVYIIDEVHMLSTGAFNALLKTLEEPPKHVVFILATTDPQKLPATVLSRCQRFDFRRITVDSIAEYISDIAAKSGVTLQKEAARLIAKISDGAMRDAISMLDQCISQGENDITYDGVLQVVGIVNETFITDVVDCLSKKDIRKVLGLIEKLIMDGKEISQLVTDLILRYRNILICKIDKNPGEIIEASAESIEQMKEQSKKFERDEIVYIIKELSLLGATIKWSAHQRVLVEVALIKICEGRFDNSDSSIEERLSAIEKKLNNTEYVARPVNKDNSIPSNISDLNSDNVKDIPEKNNSKEISNLKEKNDANEASAKKVENNKKEKSPEKVTPTENTGEPLEMWAEVITELKNSGRMTIYTNLIGTKAMELDSKFVGIVFPAGSSFKKMLISKSENMEVVEAAISKKLCKETRVKCLDEEDDKENTENSENEQDDFMGKAKSIADKLNITINIMDE